MFLLCSLLCGAALVWADQIIKDWAVRALSSGGEIRLIDGVLHLVYHENTGAAFSILQGRLPLLVVVTSVVLAGILFVLVTKKVTEHCLVAALSLIVSGGLGNLMDRVARGFVVDYIYFVPINFPVFNLADSCVVVGTGLFMLYVLFVEPRSVKKLGQKLLGEGADTTLTDEAEQEQARDTNAPDDPAQGGLPPDKL